MDAYVFPFTVFKVRIEQHHIQKLLKKNHQRTYFRYLCFKIFAWTHNKTMLVHERGQKSKLVSSLTVVRPQISGPLIEMDFSNTQTHNSQISAVC